MPVYLIAWSVVLAVLYVAMIEPKYGLRGYALPLLLVAGFACLPSMIPDIVRPQGGLSGFDLVLMLFVLAAAMWAFWYKAWQRRPPAIASGRVSRTASATAAAIVMAVLGVIGLYAWLFPREALGQAASGPSAVIGLLLGASLPLLWSKRAARDLRIKLLGLEPVAQAVTPRWQGIAWSVAIVLAALAAAMVKDRLPLTGLAGALVGMVGVDGVRAAIVETQCQAELDAREPRQPSA